MRFRMTESWRTAESTQRLLRLVRFFVHDVPMSRSGCRGNAAQPELNAYDDPARANRAPLISEPDRKRSRHFQALPKLENGLRQGRA